jgi:hypothetical protein
MGPEALIAAYVSRLSVPPRLGDGFITLTLLRALRTDSFPPFSSKLTTAP